MKFTFFISDATRETGNTEIDSSLDVGPNTECKLLQLLFTKLRQIAHKSYALKYLFKFGQI